MNKLALELYDLLQIAAPSGKEERVVRYIKPRMEQILERVFLDRYGNLLGERTYKTGQGPTILLSAHMDSVAGIEPGRKVIRDQDIYYASKGILGADDRAGMAIVLAVIRNLARSSFNGKVKVAFTREEEIGRKGSQALDQAWLGDVELAIVVDRRGNRDIVTSYADVQPFCHPSVGQFFEEAGRLCGMPDWKAVRGGISDACTFASYGINSVNLSAGFQYEHTWDEFVSITSCKETVQLITTALDIAGKSGVRVQMNVP
ncbi:M20/M25/M40 family metallo-hydrolase [Brevibacillus sp. B_LB10_24]|uniref:M20/M25/M40 family metallo-hydrolase n=1 Tax=Brevibacillus sp. B_LB10_24 TaxID=3380645 RepID=UPI0038BBD6B8